MEWNGMEWNGMLKQKCFVFFLTSKCLTSHVTRSWEELLDDGRTVLVLLHLPPLPDLVVVNARLVRVPQLHECVLHVDVDVLVFDVERWFGGSRELGDVGEHVAMVEARRVGVREHFVRRRGGETGGSGGSQPL